MKVIVALDKPLDEAGRAALERLGLRISVVAKSTVIGTIDETALPGLRAHAGVVGVDTGMRTRPLD